MALNAREKFIRMIEKAAADESASVHELQSLLKRAALRLRNVEKGLAEVRAAVVEAHGRLDEIAPDLGNKLSK